MRSLNRSELAILLFAISALWALAAEAAGGPLIERFETAVPDPALAARLFEVESDGLEVIRDDQRPPAWQVRRDGRPLGLIVSTWEIAQSVGYSGRPIDILVALDAQGRIAGAELQRHNEPILTLGISSEDIARYVSAFSGHDITQSGVKAFEASDDLPPIIAGATVSTGVIRDAILRTARTTALARGLIGGETAGIDRTSYVPKTWGELVADGSLAHASVTLSEARDALGAGKNPPPEGEAPFLDLWVAILDPPTIGRNLLGQQAYSRAMATLPTDDSALFVASRGLHSPRGVEWRRSGDFDRIQIVQGPLTLRLRADDYQRLDSLATEGAPEFKERSLFRLDGESGFDPAEPFRIEVFAWRDTEDGGRVDLVVPLDYALPEAYVLSTPAVDVTADFGETEPLWRSAWEAKRAEVAGVVVMLLILGAILIFQGPFVRRPQLWRAVRLGYLATTLIWLGWIAGGQLSVVQVVAFLQSLLYGFRWETFLIEPIIFLLWGFVALGLLFLGRGVFCGWLCPFGALQELTNQLARRLGIPQIEVPFPIHERLWAIKYVIFVGILALSFYSMEQALVMAEVEPFKTAISMHFMRAWPFVAFVVVLLAAGLFIERFYCRYLCPLGAALGIPAKLKLFDWLRRRPQCGRECRLCEKKCTVGAIDPLGRINPNECVLCLRCQVILNDPQTCTVLKNRAARFRRPSASGGSKS